RMTADRAGALWAIFEGKGLFTLRSGVWHRFQTAPDVAGKPTAAFTDGEGRLWFGYSGGRIVTVAGPQLQTVSSYAETPVGDVHAIRGNGRHVWIAGALGLAIFTEGGFRKMAPMEGGLFRNVSGLEETPEG